jgi:hypothetical protein
MRPRCVAPVTSRHTVAPCLANIQDGKKAKGHDLSRAAKPAKKRPGFSP